MNKKFVSILFAVFMATGMPVSVSAQEQEYFEEVGGNGGFYFVLDGGLRGFLNDAEVDLRNAEAFSVDYSDGYIFGGGLGYESRYGWRSEVAVSYSVNEADAGALIAEIAGRGSTVRAISTGVDVSTLNVLAKGIFDFHLRQYKNFSPYAGVAWGYGRYKFDDFIVTAQDGVVSTAFTIPGGTESYFAYGGLFGFRYSVSEQLSVGLEASSLIYYDSDDPESSYNFKARVYYSF